MLLEYPIASTDSRFSIATRFETAGLRSVTTRFAAAVDCLPDGVERAFQFHGDSGVVRLDPRWFQAASRFVVDGFFHILGGVDHLLFLLCLVIPFRRFGALVVDRHVVHRRALDDADRLGVRHGAVGALWFPPLVETLIAASIVYMALENIVSPALRRRWMITFGFGLVHGFGFSFALRDSLQFAGNHLLTSLLSFNVGVELGQLLVLVLAIPALDAAVPLRCAGADGHDRALGVRGAHRLALDDRARRPAGAVPVRVAGLRRSRFSISLLRWAMVAVALAGCRVVDLRRPGNA